MMAHAESMPKTAQLPTLAHQASTTDAKAECVWRMKPSAEAPTVAHITLLRSATRMVNVLKMILLVKSNMLRITFPTVAVSICQSSAVLTRLPKKLSVSNNKKTAPSKLFASVWLQSSVQIILVSPMSNSARTREFVLRMKSCAPITPAVHPGLLVNHSTSAQWRHHSNVRMESVNQSSLLCYMTTMVVMLRFAVLSILHSLVLMVSALVINLSAESNLHAQLSFHTDVSIEPVPNQLLNVIQSQSAQPVNHFSVLPVSVPNMLSSVIQLVFRPAQKANHSFVLQVSVLSPHFTVYHFIKEMVNPTSKVNNI